MEMNNTNQPETPSQSSAPLIQSTFGSQKPFWKTDFFAVLALFIFWPIGLFLIWKYASWKKWVKGLLTFFFLLGVLPILLIWTLIFGLKGYSLIDNTLNPRVVNQSKLYTCRQVNTEWSRCINNKYKFSFEYPANWNYIDLKPEGIGFGPSNQNLLEKNVISISPSKWKTEEDAKQFAKGFADISKKQVTTIDDLYATKDYNAFSGDGLIVDVVIADGNMTYQFMSIPNKMKEDKIPLNSNQLQAIIDHMADSFKMEKF